MSEPARKAGIFYADIDWTASAGYVPILPPWEIAEVTLDDLTDNADWTGIDMNSVGVVGQTHGYEYHGYRYVTPGEVAVARLLDLMGVPFTPDVFIKVKTPLWPGRLPLVYVPDFVLNGRAYVWTEADGSRELIHGFEVKQRSRDGDYPARGMRKIAALREAKGIRIKILDELWIRSQSRLLLAPFDSGS